jgi:hypothetical protein
VYEYDRGTSTKRRPWPGSVVQPEKKKVERFKSMKEKSRS